MTEATSSPRTLGAYLEGLRQSLSGLPKAVIQDAMADAEEHVRAEMAARPNLSEAEVLARVTAQYGRPSEVADEYRKMESGADRPAAREDQPPRSLLRKIFGVFVDPHAYGALVYMLLAFFTGLGYFVFVTVGLSLSLGLMVLIIGIPVALLFIGLVRLLSFIEGRIVELLLGRRMPRRMPVGAPPQGLWNKVMSILKDGRTWTSMFYMALQLPLGILYFLVLGTFVFYIGAFIAGPLVEMATGNETMNFCAAGFIEHSGGTIQNFQVFHAVASLLIDSSHFFWSLACSPESQAFIHTGQGHTVLIALGFVLLFVLLHVARFIGRVHSKWAEALLVKI